MVLKSPVDFTRGLVSRGLGRQGLLHRRALPPALAPVLLQNGSRWRVGESIIVASSVVAYGRASLLRFWLSPGLILESYSKVSQAAHDGTRT